MQWGLILFFVGESFVINQSTANALNLPSSVVGLCVCSMGGDELISLGCRWDDPQEHPAFFCVVYLAQCVAHVVQILSAKMYKVICCIAFPLPFFWQVSNWLICVVLTDIIRSCLAFCVVWCVEVMVQSTQMPQFRVCRCWCWWDCYICTGLLDVVTMHIFLYIYMYTCVYCLYITGCSHFVFHCVCCMFCVFSRFVCVVVSFVAIGVELFTVGFHLNGLVFI